MKLSEYLTLRGSQALTNAEANAIGVKMKKGWVKRCGHYVVPEELVAAIDAMALKSRLDKKRTLKAVAKSIKDTPQQKRKERKSSYAARSDAFLKSRAWRELRYEILKERGAVCECCGASAKTGAVIQVDHIKPRFRFPELALEKSNLQVLCMDCNTGKGAWDQTDWRGQLPDLDAQYAAIMQGV